MKNSETKKKLLFSVTKKDLVITWFSGKGPGGQHRNKHQNCCRIKHPDSGALVVCQEERSRKANLRKAFIRLVNNKKFRNWIRIQASREYLKDIELEKEIWNKVEESMKEENLKIEYL